MWMRPRERDVRHTCSVSATLRNALARRGYIDMAIEVEYVDYHKLKYAARFDDVQVARYHGDPVHVDELDSWLSIACECQPWDSTWRRLRQLVAAVRLSHATGMALHLAFGQVVATVV